MGKAKGRSKAIDVTKQFLRTTSVADHITVYLNGSQSIQATENDLSPTQGSESAFALRKEGKLDASMKLCSNWRQGACHSHSACTYAHLKAHFNTAPGVPGASLNSPSSNGSTMVGASGLLPGQYQLPLAYDAAATVNGTADSSHGYPLVGGGLQMMGLNGGHGGVPLVFTTSPSGGGVSLSGVAGAACLGESPRAPLGHSRATVVMEEERGGFSVSSNNSFSQQQLHPPPHRSLSAVVYNTPSTAPHYPCPIHTPEHHSSSRGESVGALPSSVSSSHERNIPIPRSQQQQSHGSGTHSNGGGTPNLSAMASPPHGGGPGPSLVSSAAPQNAWTQRRAQPSGSAMGGNLSHARDAAAPVLPTNASWGQRASQRPINFDSLPSLPATTGCGAHGTAIGKQVSHLSRGKLQTALERERDRDSSLPTPKVTHTDPLVDAYHDESGVKQCSTAAAVIACTAAATDTAAANVTRSQPVQPPQALESVTQSGFEEWGGGVDALGESPKAGSPRVWGETFLPWGGSGVATTAESFSAMLESASLPRHALGGDAALPVVADPLGDPLGSLRNRQETSSTPSKNNSCGSGSSAQKQSPSLFRDTQGISDLWTAPGVIAAGSAHSCPGSGARPAEAAANGAQVGQLTSPLATSGALLDRGLSCTAMPVTGSFPGLGDGVLPVTATPRAPPPVSSETLCQKLMRELVDPDEEQAPTSSYDASPASGGLCGSGALATMVAQRHQLSQFSTAYNANVSGTSTDIGAFSCGTGLGDYEDIGMTFSTQAFSTASLNYSTIRSTANPATYHDPAVASNCSASSNNVTGNKTSYPYPFPKPSPHVHSASNGASASGGAVSMPDPRGASSVGETTVPESIQHLMSLLTTEE